MNPPAEATNVDQKRAIAVAEAAVATAQAAVEVIRLTRPSIFVRDYAAIAIQTAFRGYLVIYLCTRAYLHVFIISNR